MIKKTKKALLVLTCMVGFALATPFAYAEEVADDSGVEFLAIVADAETTANNPAETVTPSFGNGYTLIGFGTGGTGVGGGFGGGGGGDEDEPIVPVGSKNSDVSDFLEEVNEDPNQDPFVPTTALTPSGVPDEKTETNQPTDKAATSKIEEVTKEDGKEVSKEVPPTAGNEIVTVSEPATSTVVPTEAKKEDGMLIGQASGASLANSASVAAKNHSTTVDADKAVPKTGQSTTLVGILWLALGLVVTLRKRLIN